MSSFGGGDGTRNWRGSCRRLRNANFARKGGFAINGRGAPGCAGPAWGDLECPCFPLALLRWPPDFALFLPLLVWPDPLAPAFPDVPSLLSPPFSLDLRQSWWPLPPPEWSPVTTARRGSANCDHYHKTSGYVPTQFKTPISAPKLKIAADRYCNDIPCIRARLRWRFPHLHNRVARRAKASQVNPQRDSLFKRRPRPWDEGSTWRYLRCLSRRRYQRNPPISRGANPTPNSGPGAECVTPPPFPLPQP